MAKRAHQVTKLPTIQRLPAYLRQLRIMAAAGREHVSTTHLAKDLGLLPIIVRKDLAETGIVGRPRVGYSVPDLVRAIETFLGWDNVTEAFLVGVGHLGTALLNYEAFSKYGLNIVAGFDTDPEKQGTTAQGKDVFPLEKLPNLASRMHIRLGVLTVPAEHAQGAANVMIASGIRGIWNFTRVPLDVPDGVVTHATDLASELGVLSVKLQKVVGAGSAVGGNA